MAEDIRPRNGDETNNLLRKIGLILFNLSGGGALSVPAAVGGATEATLATRASEATLATRASEATLATRASEATLGEVLAKLQDINDNLANGVATEATLVTIFNTLNSQLDILNAIADSVASIDAKTPPLVP